MCRPGSVMARYYSGHTLALSGNHSAARSAWSHTIESAAKLGMRYYEGLAHRELGRASAPGTALKAKHLARAAALLSECGVRNYALTSDA
jgi:hypothetical protein